MERPVVVPQEQNPDSTHESEHYFGLAEETENDEEADHWALFSIATCLMELRGVMEIQNHILAELLVNLPKGR